MKTQSDLTDTFRIPAYRDQSVSEDVNVFFELTRPSDDAVSEPQAFQYKPREEVRWGKSE